MNSQHISDSKIVDYEEGVQALRKIASTLEKLFHTLNTPSNEEKNYIERSAERVAATMVEIELTGKILQKNLEFFHRELETLMGIYLCFKTVVDISETFVATVPEINTTFYPKILWVEDDKDYVSDLIPEMSNSGFKVTNVNTVQQARELFHKRFFDLIITDVDLDGMESGFDLYREVTKKRPKQPIMFLTRSPKPDILFEDCLFLEKNIGNKTVVTILKSALGHM